MISLTKRIINIILLISSSYAFANEDIAPPPISNSNNKSFFAFKTAVTFGTNDNVFKTPDNSYVDPETALLTKTSPTSSPFVTPEIAITGRLLKSKKWKTHLIGQYMADFYTENGNSKNANESETAIKLKTSYNTKKKKIIKSVSSPILVKDEPIEQKNKKRSFFKKFGFAVEAYNKIKNVNYLNHGTGDLRKTAASSTPEDMRYKYNESAIYINLFSDFSTKTKLTETLGLALRDYDEVSVLDSLDRKLANFKIKISQRLTKHFNLYAQFGLKRVEFDTHNAYNITGNSVNGTIRKYNDKITTIGLNYKKRGLYTTLAAELASRDDLYAGYWSFDQTKYIFEIGNTFKHNNHVAIKTIHLEKKYLHDTSPILLGAKLRTQKLSSIDLSYLKKFDWGNVELVLSKDSQTDTDEYYAFNRNVVLLKTSATF